MAAYLDASPACCVGPGPGPGPGPPACGPATLTLALASETALLGIIGGARSASTSFRLASSSPGITQHFNSSL